MGGGSVCCETFEMLKRIKRGALRKFAFVWRAWGLEGDWGLRNITLCVERTFVFQAPLWGSIVSSSLGGAKFSSGIQSTYNTEAHKGRYEDSKTGSKFVWGSGISLKPVPLNPKPKL